MVQHLLTVLDGAARRLALLVLVLASIVSISIIGPAPRASAVGVDSLLNLGLGSNSCAVPTVGWVLCPTMRIIASLADGGFAFLNKDNLALNYNNYNTNSTGSTFRSWDIMRLVANGFFVIIFLYIIYGYLIGKTGGAYALKRLLPRLIITAIVVNTSFFIGVIFVDISNIIGDSIWTIFSNIYSNSPLNAPVFKLGPTTDNVLATTTAAVLGTPVIWTALLPLMLIVNVSIALVTGAIVILMIMREAAVATLLIVSPILIVLYLLPNLERISSQALRLFFQLLILYPVIATLLGVGQIVSLGAGADGLQKPFIAAAAAALPLLAVWFLFKNASNFMDMAGARLSASIGSRRAGSFDKDARVTGKASAGASALKSALGISQNGLNRKQAFSRNRRRSSLADTTLVASGIRSRDGSSDRVVPQTQNNFDTTETSMYSDGTNQAATPMVSDQGPGSQLKNLGNNVENSFNASGNIKATDLDGTEIGANINGSGSIGPDVITNQPEQPGGTGDMIMTALLGAKGREKDDDKKPVTAKDIFSSMNRGLGHESKDKQRSFSSGPGPAGGTQQGGPSQSGTPTMSPVTNYAAPSMAQGVNIVSSSSANQAPVSPIAVPVTVDASSLLQKRDISPASAPSLPVLGTQKDAEARANKYLFDAQKDINEAKDAEEILGHKRDVTFEPPHTSVESSGLQDQDDKK
jgi:hypothetical protein